MNTIANKLIIFENDNKVDEYKLTHCGKLVFTGSENHCFIQLQKSQSQSGQWAIRHEGWKIEPTGNEMPDPRITVKITRHKSPLGRTIGFEYRGEQYEIAVNSVYGNLGLLNEGDTVDVDSFYAYYPHKP